ncbi:hypothetical protein JCM10207_007456 [Rhodosporidiobolus poonsookiae]
MPAAASTSTSGKARNTAAPYPQAGSDRGQSPSEDGSTKAGKGKKGGGGGDRTRHLSCENCRIRKMKCSRQSPCLSCRMRGDECIWIGAAPNGSAEEDELEQSAAEVARLKRLVDLLLARLEEQDEAQRESGVADMSGPFRHEHPHAADGPAYPGRGSPPAEQRPQQSGGEPGAGGPPPRPSALGPPYPPAPHYDPYGYGPDPRHWPSRPGGPPGGGEYAYGPPSRFPPGAMYDPRAGPPPHDLRPGMFEPPPPPGREQWRP